MQSALMKKFLLLIFSFSVFTLWATHQRAGEITYRHISGLTYEFTLVTYTFTPSPADRPELDLIWGDGTESTVARIQKIDYPNDISKNTYVATHTFPAPGTYTVSMEDPNRNYGVINIPNSVNIPFYLETIITIHPFLGGNSSPVLLNPPVDNGCVNTPFYHNPSAYDPDGDSLSYKLVNCLGLEGEVIPGYSLPLASNSITIDPVTGDLFWDSPILQGEYNIAILIEEWRAGVKIGSVLRDMQINIGACNNTPPEIEVIEDTCIVAGTNFQTTVKATDAQGDKITLTATGGPFNVEQSPAIFPQSIYGFGQVQADFKWSTNCSHVRKHPYQVSFKAEDNNIPINLVSMKTMRITVVSPAPENLTADPLGNSIVVRWDSHNCRNANGYKVYRHNGPSGWTHDHCETGVPEYTSFQLVGTSTSILDTIFVDDNAGQGLIYGNQYCYVVVATFPDFAESYASNEACASLKREVPIITNVSVEETSSTDGKIFIRWTKPTELDFAQFPGPHQYKILRSTTVNGTYSEIGTLDDLNDTTFFDTNINTVSNTWFYKIELNNLTPENSLTIGTSNPAGSIFINLTPNDRKITLSWNENTPWTNFEYTVFRKNLENSLWDSIATTHEKSFVDFPLENDIEQCYFIRSSGEYTIDGIESPLINFSQKSCQTPIDNEPPCVPILQGETDCETNTYTIQLPADSCLLDVYGYYVYFNSSNDGIFVKIDSVFDVNLHQFQIANMEYMAGCVAISAFDLSYNESALSNFVCIDLEECNPYVLPNVFTPNGDNYNDLFVPFPYSFVESIDMKIYNRWGNIVYKTKNPDVLWDGKDQFTGNDCAEGVYYYICDVFEYRIGGIKKRTLQGTVSLFR